MDDMKTHELDNIVNFITNEKDLNEYITKTIADSVNVDFVNYLDKLLNCKGLSKAKVIAEADIDRTYGYQILNGKKYASRDKILKICIAAKFTSEETNRLLSIGGYTRLYSKDPRDTVITFCLNKGLSVLDTDLMLDKYHQPSLSDDN